MHLLLTFSHPRLTDFVHQECGRVSPQLSELS